MDQMKKFWNREDLTSMIPQKKKKKNEGGVDIIGLRSHAILK